MQRQTETEIFLSIVCGLFIMLEMTFNKQSERMREGKCFSSPLLLIVFRSFSQLEFFLRLLN